MSHHISVRYLREHLAAVLKKVGKGQLVVISQRGRPVARIVPDRSLAAPQREPYALRGSVKRLAKDFDAPLDEIWDAHTS